MSTICQSLEYEIAGEHFVLDCRHALWHPKTSSLMVADMHLGKSQTFLRAGVAVPDSSASDLELLATLVQGYQAERLIVLGDLFHDQAGITPEILDRLSAFLAEHQSLVMELIVGNHDQSAFGKNKQVQRAIEDMMVLTKPSRALAAGIELAHHPIDSDSDGEVSDSAIVCGHLHPAVSMPMRGSLNTRLPAFIHTPPNFILPAFGRFTGCKTVKLKTVKNAWPVTPEGLFAFSPGN